MMVSRHERDGRAGRDGFQIADELLEKCRPLEPLPPAAHARVKRRLLAQAARRPARAFPWLQFAVVGITMLMCGGAFGVALERLVLRPRPSPQVKVATTERLRKPSGKARPAAARTSAEERPADERSSPGTVELQGANAPAVPTPVPATVPALPADARTPPRASPIPSTRAESAAPARKLALRDPALASAPAPVWPVPAPYAAAPASPSAPTTAVWPPPPSALAARAEATVPSVAPAPPPPVPAAWPSPAPADSAALPVVERASPTRTAVVAAPAVAAAPLSEERLLARAVRALRADKNPGSALAVLDEYAERYQHGRFTVEATILRVDAMLALGRRDEALPMLDGLDLAQVPGGSERQLQRGELRARAGRWDDAGADYDRVLANASPRESSLLERAWSGRIEAWRHLGDDEQARKAAAEYLRRFPDGRFAAQAKILLGSPPP